MSPMRFPRTSNRSTVASVYHQLSCLMATAILLALMLHLLAAPAPAQEAGPGGAPQGAATTPVQPPAQSESANVPAPQQPAVNAAPQTQTATPVEPPVAPAAETPPGAASVPATTSAAQEGAPMPASAAPPAAAAQQEQPAVMDSVPSAAAEPPVQVENPAASRQPAAGALPHDLSPWGMFEAADIVVKAVMIGLALASLITWTVWLAKALELWAAKRRAKRAIREIMAAPDLGAAIEAFARIKGTGAALVRAAGEEMARSLPALGHTDGQGVKERVTSRLSRIEANAGRRMALGTGVLATIGATAPFVGLFGTVWGIMNSFIGISQSQTTNLAVVAPGIAEALLATALGLVAAIPAVIIYNIFARSIAGYKLLLADASAGVERLVSWELDSRRIPSHAPVARAAE